MTHKMLHHLTMPQVINDELPASPTAQQPRAFDAQKRVETDQSGYFARQSTRTQTISVVTWTRTPTSTGTRLHVEPSGFWPDQEQPHQGAKAGRQPFFANLGQVVAGLG